MRLAYRAALAGTILAIGCGGGDDGNGEAGDYSGEEAEVAAVIDRLAEAGRAGDGQRVCDEVFALPLARNIERESGQSCADEVEENVPEGEYELTIDRLELEDDAARVTVTDQADNQSAMHLVRTDDEWRVLRVTEP